MVKRLLLGLLGLLLVLVAVVAINTWRQGSRQIEVPALAPLDIDKDGAARRLGEAVRLRTISSRDDPALNTDQFQQLQALLQARYPKAHAVMKRELVGDLSLLYTWPGSDPGARPIVVMAHQDVVPVAPGTDKDWRTAGRFCLGPWQLGQQGQPDRADGSVGNAGGSRLPAQAHHPPGGWRR